MFDKPDLAGRVAIVTGSSRGIGKAVALALAEAGCDVVVAAKTTEPTPGLPGTILETRDAVVALGRRALAVATDVRDEAQIAHLVARTVDELGRVDVVVNNAGALWWKNVVDTPPRRFDLVMGVNARASFALAHYALPHMIANGWGHIINMSPPIDLRMVPGKVAYSISKFGMTLIAHGLAEEVREHGVAVNALWPATVIESQASINYGLGTPEVWRKPDIVADAVLAICAHTPPKLTGRALLDEEILRMVGVTDLTSYACVEGGTPLRIVDESAVGMGHGAGGTPSTATGDPAGAR